MIKAIIFDCFGVLAGEGIVPFRKRHFGGDAAVFAKSKALTKQMVTGDLSYDELLVEFSKLADIPLGQVVEEITTLAYKKNHDLLAFIKEELKPKFKIGVLSNTSEGQFEAIFNEFMDLFDATVLSYRDGVAKPDKEAFQLIADKLKVRTDECVYVDDIDRNIVAAHKSGMLPIRYISFRQFKRDIKSTIEDPAGNPMTVLESVIKKYGDKPYKLVDHGYQNLVAIIDNKYVARVPRDQRAAKILIREYKLLTLIKGLEKPPVKIQKVVEFSQSPAYMVCDYIAGDSMLEYDIPDLDEKTQENIGRAVGRFAYWLGSVSNPQLIKKVAASMPESLAWDGYLKLTIESFDDAGYPTLSAHAKRLSALSKKYYPNGADAVAGQIVHDDLYAGNIIFNESLTPVGVIDFSDMGVGDAEREMRQIYRTGPVVFEACAAEYETLRGRKIVTEKVRFWAEAQEFAALCDKINNKSHPSYKRGLRNVKRWYTQEDWSELERDKVTAGKND